MKMLKDMSKDERSLLLFFETCAVDSYGKIKSVHMNKEDFCIAENWNTEGFVKFGRIKSKDLDLKGYRSSFTHWCILSDDAWNFAHRERKERSKRMGQFGKKYKS